MKNFEHMVQKCRRFGEKRVFLSGIVYTKRINQCVLNDLHDSLLILCRRLDIDYTDNRNSREKHLFKGGHHLLDTGKRILVNFVFNLNFFFVSNTTTNFTRWTDYLESNCDKYKSKR